MKMNDATLWYLLSVQLSSAFKFLFILVGKSEVVNIVQSQK